MLEAVTTHETDIGAYDATLDLPRRHPSLAAVYVEGRGIRGAIRAIRGREGQRPHLISCELNDETRQALVEGYLSVALSHPMSELADRLVATMLDLVDGDDRGRIEAILPFATTTAEAFSDTNWHITKSPFEIF